MQDAFELCIVRLDGNGGIFKHAGETGTRQDVPPAKSSDKITEEISMKDRGKKDASYSAIGFIAEIVAEGSSLPCPPSTINEFEATRLESVLDPAGVAKTQPSSSRASTNLMSSTDDLFYIAPASMTPAGGKRLSVAEATRKDGVSISTYMKRSGWVTEFGVNEENGPEGGDDESTGLLSAHMGPRQSMLFREWSGSTASRLSRKMSGDVSQHSHSTTSGEGSRSGTITTTPTRRRANTASHPHALDLVRAGSSSITMIKDSLNGAALVAINGSSGFVRRARSGTILSNSTERKRCRKVNNDEGSEELTDDGK